MFPSLPLLLLLLLLTPCTLAAPLYANVWPPRAYNASLAYPFGAYCVNNGARAFDYALLSQHAPQLVDQCALAHLARLANGSLALASDAYFLAATRLAANVDELAERFNVSSGALAFARIVVCANATATALCIDGQALAAVRHAPLHRAQLVLADASAGQVWAFRLATVDGGEALAASTALWAKAIVTSDAGDVYWEVLASTVAIAGGNLANEARNYGISALVISIVGLVMASVLMCFQCGAQRAQLLRGEGVLRAHTYTPIG